MLLGEIQDRLIQEEGIRLKCYKDTEGNWTGGVGHLLKEDMGYITLEQAGIWLREDIFNALKICDKIPCFFELDEARRYVLISLAFNLGTRIFTFKKMLLALENRNYELASKEMLDSKWARQVKSRAKKLSDIMRTGHL